VSFSLHPRLSHDTVFVADLPLCRVLMMNDMRWPWLILVPRGENLVELTDLDAADRARLIEEAARAADWLKAHAKADKINVGALGNVVRQLHVHVVARHSGDAGWPGPVWGFGTALPYAHDELQALIAAARKGLGGYVRPSRSRSIEKSSTFGPLSR
jgi:diadenosine tetraphosphate (Ap4A) HIT family hydrolase